MSHLGFTVVICLGACLYPVTSRAGVLVATRAPYDNGDVVRQLADDARVAAYRRESDAFL